MVPCCDKEHAALSDQGNAIIHTTRYLLLERRGKQGCIAYHTFALPHCTGRITRHVASGKPGRGIVMLGRSGRVVVGTLRYLMGLDIV